jgi:hypothetical protein
LDPDPHTATVTCDAGGLRADIHTVDALARLQLAARRSGARVDLQNASDELLELLDLCGLCEVLRGAELGVGRALRQAEQREHPVGVEERHLRGDPPV